MIDLSSLQGTCTTGPPVLKKMAYKTFLALLVLFCGDWPCCNNRPAWTVAVLKITLTLLNFFTQRKTVLGLSAELSWLQHNSENISFGDNYVQSNSGFNVSPDFYLFLLFHYSIEI